jgi:hypothetical protein
MRLGTFSFWVLLPLLLAAELLRGQTSTATVPVGCISVTLSGAVNGVPAISTFSPCLRLPISPSFVGKSRGTFTAVTSTTLSDNEAGWTAGALSQAALPYFVRIRSGAAAGTWWQVSTSTANTSSLLSVYNRNQALDSTLGIVVGDAYEIVPGDTLSTLFAGLESQIGGLSSMTADVVRLHDGVIWHEYYYNSTSAKWKEGSSSFDRSNIVIRPDAGVVYIRRGTGDLGLSILGFVSDAQERILIAGTGVTTVGNVFPVVRSLGSLNIQNMPGFIANTGSVSSADKLRIFDGVLWKIYNYNSANSQWREGTSSFNRNATSLPFGALLIVERGTGAIGSAAFLTLDLPYTL